MSASSCEHTTADIGIAESSHSHNSNGLKGRRKSVQVWNTAKLTLLPSNHSQAKSSGFKATPRGLELLDVCAMQ